MSDPAGRLGAMRKWLPLITVSLGTFMLLVDVTIVNVALPDMQRTLHLSNNGQIGRAHV